MSFKLFLCLQIVSLLHGNVHVLGNEENKNGEKMAKMAVCKMSPENGMGAVNGTIHLKQEEGSTTLEISGTIVGAKITDGKHGFHVHEFAGLGNECKDAGGHFNPKKVTHGGPQDTIRHVGDLGNVMASNEKVDLDITDQVASLTGENSIIGKSMVLHAGEDDLGRGGASNSNTTGNAGGRLGCCVIESGSPRVSSGLITSFVIFVAVAISQL